VSGAESLDDAAVMAVSLRDPQQFAVIYRRHAQDIYTFLRRRGLGDADAQDLTGATFELALRRRNQYRLDRGSVRAWLFGIATNQHLDMVRATARRSSERAQRAMHLLSDGPASGTVLSFDVDHDPQLRMAMDRLPPRYATVLSLRFYAGLPPAEVAAAMGMPASRCAVVTHRALAALRRELAATPRVPMEAQE
jgi:RNA polymerase sigma-70 factor (ECF subfamily)